MSDEKEDKLQAQKICAAEIYSTNNDEVIQICADLIPDDIDMYPRLIGSRSMPFREVVAERFCGELEPLDERDCIGGVTPFDRIRAKEIYGNFHGPINGLAFPGTFSGYGWMLVLAENSPDGISAGIQRAAWPAKYYTIRQQTGQNPHILIHPGTPFIPFIVGNPVFVECIKNDLSSGNSVTSAKSYIPTLNQALKLPQIDIELDIPQNISSQYQILIRLY